MDTKVQEIEEAIQRHVAVTSTHVEYNRKPLASSPHAVMTSHLLLLRIQQYNSCRLGH